MIYRFFVSLGLFLCVASQRSAGQSEKQRVPAAPLAPTDAAQSFDVAEDLVLEQVLAEPEVVKPVFLNFDERGRMWVVEYRQYPEPAGLKVLSHDSFWRAVYDKVPLPPPHHVRGRDRITIHESTKGDGVFDKHSVFVDGLSICTAVERQRGGVWVLNPPYLLWYPDADGDDVPDGDPTVHLAGFGIEDTHSVANSLRWGPDGWLYGAHGSTVTASITRPGIDQKPIAEMQGQAIWRYHPLTRRFEVFCEGGGNTFGVELDAQGRIFSGHNGGDTRGFHYMQGAYLRKGFDKHGPLSNPYTFGYFDQMAHAKVERFTHNFIIYEGGALPGHAGRLFGAEPMQGRLVESEITPVGSTFRTRDLQRPVTSRDPWFRPVDIKVGPDGAIYLCDWYVPQLAHSRTYSDLQQGPLDLSRGRIYRLRAKGAHSLPPPDLSKLDTSHLVAGLRDENKWVRQTVQRLLADRRDVEIIPALRSLLETSKGQHALELLWALHSSGGLDESAAGAALGHPDPFVRLWTVRLLGDGSSISSSLAAQLVRLAKDEPNVEVRAQLACSAKRLPAHQDLEIVRRLLDHDEDAGDPRLPLLLWWAIEARAESDSEAVLAMFREPGLWDRPIVKEHLLERVLRRYAQSGTRRDLLVCASLFELAPTPEHSRKLTAGMEAAFKGRPLSGLPPELISSMRRHGADSLALRLRAGEADAVEKAVRLIGDDKAPLQSRLECIAIFGERQNPAAIEALLAIVERTRDEALRKAALGALAPYDDIRIAPRVVAAFSRFGKDGQAAAGNLLAARARTASLLMRGVENGSIARAAVPLEIVRQIRLFAEDDIPARTAKIWGTAGRQTSEEMSRKIEHFAAVVREGGGGDPYAGRAIYTAVCSGCHALHGQGGQVGPDLTKFKRDDVEGLLLNIVNPNAEIREGYENFVIRARDGRTLAGFLVEQAPQFVVLRGLDGQNVSLARGDVEEMKPVGVSLMPEGLLDDLEEKQVRDLFAYLRMTQPLVGKGP